MMILFLIIGVLGLVYFIRYLTGKPGIGLDILGDSIGGDRQSPSLEILQKRLASGEISRSEYREIRNAIIEDEDI